jgi:hypothetical protein
LINSSEICNVNDLLQSEGNKCKGGKTILPTKSILTVTQVEKGGTAVYIARTKQERILALNSSLINALVSWQKEGFLTNFKQVNVVCGRFIHGSRERWYLSAKLSWDSSNFGTQIKMRQAIINFAKQIANETGLPVDNITFTDGGDMGISLQFPIDS